MTRSVTTDYVADFQSDLEDIDKLESTPDLIRGVAIDSLDRAIATVGVPNTVKQALKNSKLSIENIKQESIADNFKTIYVQMCILAVSSLETTLKRYFVNTLKQPENINSDSKRLQEIKLSLKDIVDHELKFGGKVGQIILDKASLNFQDLQAIKRNFKEFSDKDIRLDKKTEENICFYLESRHILVHKGGVIDKKFIDATGSFGANIKQYKVGDKIELDSSDWSNIKDSFTGLVEGATKRRGKSQNF